VVHISGSAGLPGALSFNSETNEFGSVAVGSTATRTFTITNTGGTTVLITKSKPPSGGDFAPITSLPEGTTIAAGETLTETVAFTPTGTGAKEGAWTINGDDTTGLREVRFLGVGSLTAEPGGESPPPASASSLGPGLSGVLHSLETVPPPLPDLVLGSLTLRVQPTGTITVRVGCPEDVSNCAGALTLRTLTAVAVSTHARSKKSILVLASRSFSLAGGRATSVVLHPSAKARALLARVHPLRAVVTILARDDAGTTATIRKDVTIRILSGRRRP